VVGLGAAAGWDALRDDPDPLAGEERSAAAARLQGPGVPAPGALPGVLVVAEAAGCRLVAVDFATLEVSEPGVRTGCRLWGAPEGELLVANGPVGLDERPELGLFLVRHGTERIRTLGPSVSAPTWSRDGKRVAWCLDGDVSLVLDAPALEPQPVAGCFPAFLDSGEIVTRRGGLAGADLLLDGGRLLASADVLGPAAAAEGLGFDTIVGHGPGPDGSLALVVLRTRAGFDQRLRLELWDDHEPVATLPLGSPTSVETRLFGLRVEPVGSTGLALHFPEALTPPRFGDLVTFVDLRSRAETMPPEPTSGLGLAWSPDGRWLAVSSGKEVLVYAQPLLEPSYVLPIEAGALAWLYP
jgi:hypothetical protein